MINHDRNMNLQYFAGTALGMRPQEDAEEEYTNQEVEENSNEEDTNQENTSDYGYTDTAEIFPKLDMIDSNGNPIRDAKNFVFKSRVIYAANKAMSANSLYQHYE